MGYGGAVGLIVVGLILALAVNEEQVGPVNIGMIGWILTIAGVLLLVLTIAQQNTRRRTSTVATSAMPMGMPGWPDLAACTASMARTRSALARVA